MNCVAADLLQKQRNDAISAYVRGVRELVDHHVAEEESIGFSYARTDFDKHELEEMARQFQTRKAQLLHEASHFA